MVEYRYCWIKVTKVGAADIELPAERTDFAIWADVAGKPGAFITKPPLPVDRNATVRPALLAATNAMEVGLLGSCTPCPSVQAAAVMSAVERFLVVDPPAPTTVADGALTNGWQLECGSAAENIDEPPEVMFAMHPMPADTTRTAALDWLAKDGAKWAENAMSCTLMAYFQVTQTSEA